MWQMTSSQQMLVGRCCQQLYAENFSDSQKMDKDLKMHNQPILTQEEVINLQSLISTTN